MLWLPRKNGCLLAGDVREVTTDLGPRVYGDFQQYGCRSRDDLGGGLRVQRSSRWGALCREVAGGELYAPTGARVELPAMQSGHLTRGYWPTKSPKNILEKKRQILLCSHLCMGEEKPNSRKKQRVQCWLPGT